MLHPHTELRFVSSQIGYGIFVTKLIPKGTITWVKDELDRLLSPEEARNLSQPNLENLLKYSYRNAEGQYVFCWDLTRYVNHSYTPNSMITALGFEIAIRDILPGEEMTNDYGTLNIIESFECASGPTQEREMVSTDDLLKFYPEWDQQITDAFPFVSEVEQPLANFLTEEQREKLESIDHGFIPIPSILDNYFHA